MSVVAYNGVVLPYSRITSFRQEVLREEGDTDWYLTKFDVTCECVINMEYLSLILPDISANPAQGPSSSVADIMNVVTFRLMQHRKTLSIKFNGTELIPQPPVGGPRVVAGTVDAFNGPKPQSCVPVTFTDNTFLVVYHIIAHYWVNNLVVTGPPYAENRAGNPTLYNRWSETHDIDGDSFVTRIREGKFMIRSDNADDFTADQTIVQMAVVGVPPGFLRRGSQYRQSPDGLAIEYRVVDEEQFKMPPSPANRARGFYYESATRTAAKRYGEVNVWLSGSKTTPQALLLKKAIDVASSKINIRVGQLRALGATNNVILESAAARINLYDNEVEVNMRFMLPADNLRVDGIAAFVDIDTRTPESVAEYKPDYPFRGTAGRPLIAAAYYDPSLRGVVLDGQTEQLTRGTVPGQAGTRGG